ncbi:MAG TPA: ParB/RepB/Spo0J family partition protein [Verrucomicrobiae bacterium]|nr:ParB/RepB/Spo0J family partition protein [Verrucomicrobiae bacterium]
MSIQIDPALQVRVAVNTNTVTEYADAMKHGNVFPPIKVIERDGNYVLVDGRHRLEAKSQIYAESIGAEIVESSPNDAIKIALEANRQHGLRLTNADKRRAAEMVLKAWPELSDREIAQLCGTTGPTVAAVRKGVQKFYTPDTDRTGFPIPENLKEGWEQTDPLTLVADAKGVRDEIRHFERADEFRKLRREVDFKKVLSCLDNSILEIERAVPHAVCPCLGRQEDCKFCQGRGLVSKFFWDKCVPKTDREARAQAAKK